MWVEAGDDVVLGLVRGVREGHFSAGCTCPARVLLVYYNGRNSFFLNF